MSLDGSNVAYATEFVKVHESGNTSITDRIDTTVATASGGVSRTDFDSQVASLQPKDIAYSQPLTSHISLLDTNATDIATHTKDTSILNTKQIQNFAGTHDINTKFNKQLSN